MQLRSRSNAGWNFDQKSNACGPQRLGVPKIKRNPKGIHSVYPKSLGKTKFSMSPKSFGKTKRSMSPKSLGKTKCSMYSTPTRKKKRSMYPKPSGKKKRSTNSRPSRKKTHIPPVFSKPKKPFISSLPSRQNQASEIQEVLPIAKKSAPPPIHLCLDLDCCKGDEHGGEEPIDPKIPTPSREMFEKWKAFVSTAQYHPNILVHPDVRCVRELFGVLGAEIPFDNYSLMIELQESTKNTTEYQTEDKEGGNEEPCRHRSLEILQPAPAIDHNEENACDIMLADTKEIEVIPHLEAVIIREYSIVEDCKIALAELVEMVFRYPESILYPNYNFLYEFFLRFGVRPEVITKEIYDTQIRRLQNKIPPSSLLIKQGEPEVETQFNSSSKDEIAPAESQSLQNKREGRVSCGYSGTDSGFSSLDQNESSADEFEDGSGSSQEEEESDGEESLEINSVIFDDGIPQGRGKRRLRKPHTLMRTPYKCTVCPNRYAFKNNCNRHILKSHPGASLIPVKRTVCSNPEFIPPFLCSVCKKTFSSKGTCKLHIRKFHSKNRRARPERNPLIITVQPKSTPIKKLLSDFSKISDSSQYVTVEKKTSLIRPSIESHISDSGKHFSRDHKVLKKPVVISSAKSLLEYMPSVEGFNNCYVLLEKEF